MLDKDDEHSLHMHECTTYDRVRKEVAIVALLSVAMLVWATIRNVYGDDRRLRYPGRLITCFGISILMFHLLVAVGWAIDFKQLDWGDNSNYEYYHDNDEDGDKLWNDLCVAQGFMVQVCLICMAFYSAWISYAFYYVIKMRTHGNYLLRQFNEQGNLRFEMRTHLAILLFAVFTAFGAMWSKSIGSASGITACWVDGYEYQQVYFYYVWMILSVFSGVGFSLIANVKLYKILTSSDSMWLSEHRSLRRAVYGNMMWSVFITIVAVMPIIDFLTLSLALCEANNIFVNCSGIMFYLIYNVFPHYLERCFEDHRTRSLANEGGGLGVTTIDSLLNNDYASYATRYSSKSTLTTSGHTDRSKRLHSMDSTVSNTLTEMASESPLAGSGGDEDTGDDDEY